MFVCVCKRESEREEDEKIEAATHSAISLTVRSLPASLSHRPRREKGRAEEQRKETLHYFKSFFSPLVSAHLPSLPPPPCPLV